jgi:hypothetical protein
MHTEFRWESQKEEYNYEDLDVCGNVIVKWISEVEDGVVFDGLFRLGQGTGVGSCEDGNKPFGFWEILE